MKILKNYNLIVLLLCIAQFSFAQTREEKKIIKDYKLYSAEAAELKNNGDFAKAEALYRKALSKNPDGEEAAYNFGNLYYENEKKDNSALRYVESVETTENKSIKHKNYHNLGNLFMDKKDYATAVEAYKNALRNDPTDEETRYNLALAKKMLEKEQQQNQGKDKNQQQENKDKKEEKEDNKGGEGNQDKKDEQKQDQKEGDDEKENEQPDKDSKQNPKEGDNQKKEQPSNPEPRKGKMSEQQIKNLLQAIENKEKNTQKKLNAKKVKGQKVKTEKDW